MTSTSGFVTHISQAECWSADDLRVNHRLNVVSPFLVGGIALTKGQAAARTPGDHGDPGVPTVFVGRFNRIRFIGIRNPES